MRVGVLALLLVSCGSARASAPRTGLPRTSPAVSKVAAQPESAPALSPAPAASASSTPSSELATSIDAASPEPPAPVTPVAAAALTTIEPLYSALGHPRLATEMLSSTRDDELFQWALGGSSDPLHPANQPGYHPATRVVVDVELLSRAPKGTTRQLLARARSHGYWPLRSCFEEAQRLSVKTERSARVRLTLDARGRVLGARSLDKPEDRGYASCVLGRLRHLDFSPGFTRKLDVDVSVKEWPGHAPLPLRAPDANTRVSRSSTAQATIRSLQPALTACYEAGLARDPRLWGRLALRLSLDSDGVVTDAVEVETHFPDAEVTACARRLLVGARLEQLETRAITFAVRFGNQGAPPAPDAPPASEPAAPAEPESPPTPISEHLL